MVRPAAALHIRALSARLAFAEGARRGDDIGVRTPYRSVTLALRTPHSIRVFSGSSKNTFAPSLNIQMAIPCWPLCQNFVATFFVNWLTGVCGFTMKDLTMPAKVTISLEPRLQITE